MLRVEEQRRWQAEQEQERREHEKLRDQAQRRHNNRTLTVSICAVVVATLAAIATMVTAWVHATRQQNPPPFNPTIHIHQSAPESPVAVSNRPTQS